MNKTLPAEWAKQQFVQLTWPHEATDWASILDEVEACFVAIARNILRFQDLLIVCKDKVRVANLIGHSGKHKLELVELDSNDTWARDHGGITVMENNQAVVYDFCFNGWGKKFEASKDNQITRLLSAQQVFGADYSYRDCLDFVLEGGSIESDGLGTILTTTQCLLSDNRNDVQRVEAEQKLKDYFGADRVLWLEHGYLAGDDTDSHIDTLARFCDEHTIAYVRCEDESDEHFSELKMMEDELMKFRRMDGESYKLVALPMADAVYDDGERLPATYANFLIINDAVLVPTYGSEKDAIALSVLADVFQGREIIGIDCNALIKQHGSLHCVTMQYPAVKK